MTSKAVKQLGQIVDFISEDSNHYATLTVRNIFKKVRLLKPNPPLFTFFAAVRHLLQAWLIICPGDSQKNSDRSG